MKLNINEKTILIRFVAQMIVISLIYISYKTGLPLDFLVIILAMNIIFNFCIDMRHEKRKKLTKKWMKDRSK